MMLMMSNVGWLSNKAFILMTLYCIPVLGKSCRIAFASGLCRFPHYSTNRKSDTEDHFLFTHITLIVICFQYINVMYRLHKLPRVKGEVRDRTRDPAITQRTTGIRVPYIIIEKALADPLDGVLSGTV